MPFEIKQFSPRKWNMINTETGAIHSHRSKAKAEAHARLLNSMDSLTGKGLIEQKYIDSLRDPSPNFPPKVPLPVLGNLDITVPPYVVKPIEGGKKKKYKLVKTLTKSRNISTRADGVPSIQFLPETHETDASVESSGSMPTLDQFSKKDQAIIKKMFLSPNKELYLTNKQRGFPELMHKNIKRHRELGTSQLPQDFQVPPPRKRGRPKKADLQAQAEAQAKSMGLGDEIDFGDTPASTPRTPISFSLMMPETDNETGGGKEEAPVKKRGRPKKYETDEERQAIKKKQILASNKRLYIESLSPTHREKYFQKQEKKAQKGKGVLNDLKKFGNKMVKGTKDFGNKMVKDTKDLGNKAIDLLTNVSHSDKAYPPNLTAIKNQLGNELITSLQIGRTPVPSAILSAMNAVSVGNFNKVFKSLPFDTLFHLFLIITTDKGKFLLEKNERINVSKTIPSKDLEVKDVVIPNNLSVSELIDTTQKYMGNNFLPYDPATQNCQDFISSLLKANNIATPELLSFVKQDTSEIFKQNPNLAKISRKLTDIGAMVNVIQQGGSLKLKSSHNNMDGRYMFSHQLPQAESQVRASLGIARGMVGGNILGDIGNAFRSLPQKAAKALRVPTSVNDLKNLAMISQIPTNIGGVKRYGKTAISYALPAAGNAIGSELGRYASGGNPYAAAAGGTMGGIVGRIGAEQSNKAIGRGVIDRGIENTVRRIRKHGNARSMSGTGPLKGLLDKPMTLRQIVRAGKSVPALVKGAVADLKGAGVLKGVLDKPFTARQAIHLGRSIPSLAKGAVADLKGAGLYDYAMYGVAPVPEIPGLTTGVVPKVPGITTGVMSGRGAKGSQEAKDFMAKLRAMRKRK